MKRLYIILGIVISAILLFFIIAPLFIKSSIKSFIFKQIEKKTEIPYSISDVNVGIWSNFPNINIQIENFVLNDSSTYLPFAECVINPFEIWGNNEQVTIKHLNIENGRFKINRQPQNTPRKASQKSEKKKNKNLIFSDINITNCHLSYTNDSSFVAWDLEGINAQLSVNTLDSCNTSIQSSIDNVAFRQGGIQWINHSQLKWDSQIYSDIPNERFKITKSDLHLNQLFIDLQGEVFRQNGDWQTNLSLNVPNNNISCFLELLSVIKKENLDVDGQFRLNAQIKGLATDSLLPKINAQLSIADAWMCRKESQDTLKNLNIDIILSNPGDISDSTVINIEKIAFNMAEKPFGLSFFIQNPQNPYLKGSIKGSIDFDKLLPFFSEKHHHLQGVIVTDMNFDGYYSDIDREEYEKFNAKGNITLEHFRYKTETLPEGIEIPFGRITVSPNKLSLFELNAKVEDSDVVLFGYISNYFPYLFKNQNLKGELRILGDILNLNPFFTKKIRKSQNNMQSEDDVDKVLYIPEKLDLNISCDIHKLLYEKLIANNIKGDIQLKGGVAFLHNLSMDVLNGQLTLSGDYKARERHYPHFNFQLDAKNLDIKEAYQGFSFIRKSLSIAQYAEGKISADMQLEGDLDQRMNVIPKQTSGEGNLLSNGIVVNGAPSLNKMADALGNDAFKRLTIGALDIKFTMTDGNITIPPFTTTLLTNRTTISGTQSAQGEMNYKVNMDVKRPYFGEEINKAIRKIPGSKNVDSLEIDIFLQGTPDNPNVSTDLSKAIKKVMKEAEKDVRHKLLNGLDKLF